MPERQFCPNCGLSCVSRRAVRLHAFRAHGSVFRKGRLVRLRPSVYKRKLTTLKKNQVGGKARQRLRDAEESNASEDPVAGPSEPMPQDIVPVKPSKRLRSVVVKVLQKTADATGSGEDRDSVETGRHRHRTRLTKKSEHSHPSVLKSPRKTKTVPASCLSEVPMDLRISLQRLEEEPGPQPVTV